MRNAQDLAKEKQAITSLVQLTGAFEGIASMHIARIKDRVQEAEKFFDELWPIYTRLRVGKDFSVHHSQDFGDIVDKELLIVITSENSLSGDVDHRVVSEAAHDFDKSKYDIISIGHHGTALFQQRNVPLMASYRLPGEDEPINFDVIVQTVRRYRNTTVYYAAYRTLMTQEVKKMPLSRAIEQLGEAAEANEEQQYISDTSYIFEPSVEGVIEYMEQSMLYVALSQVTLFSRLAHHASRFKAMTSARTMAQEVQDDMTLQLNRLKRFIKDQRTREIVNGLQREVV